MLSVPPVTKRCTTCRETKPLTEYYRARGAVEYRPSCKACTKAKRRASYLRNGGKDIPYKQVLQREYGMTLDQYNALLRKQAHRCAICRRPESVKMKLTGEPRRLSVDHDHVTGAVRGLLCQRCNVLVWAIEDNHTSLAAIGAYVEEFRASFANGAPI